LFLQVASVFFYQNVKLTMKYLRIFLYIETTDMVDLSTPQTSCVVTATVLSEGRV